MRGDVDMALAPPASTPEMTVDEAPSESASRRQFLHDLASRMAPPAAGKLKKSLSAQPDAPLIKSVNPMGSPAAVPSLAVHAANRMMYGPRPGEVEAIDALGHDAFVEQQLYAPAIQDTECDTALAALNLLSLNESRIQLFDRLN